MKKETRRFAVKLEVQKKSGLVFGEACNAYEAPKGFMFVSVIKEADYEIRQDWRTGSPAAYELNGTRHYYYLDGGTQVELIHFELGWVLQKKFVEAEIRNAKLAK